MHYNILFDKLVEDIILRDGNYGMDAYYGMVPRREPASYIIN